jgi:hypothetical protein
VVKNFEAREPLLVEDLVEVLSFIVVNYKGEDLSVELMKKLFLILDQTYWNEVDLNVLLMSRFVISVQEWDSQMSMYLKEKGGAMPENVLQFFHAFLLKAVVHNPILSKEDIPLMVSVLEAMQTDPKIGQICTGLLDIVNMKPVKSGLGGEDELQERLRDQFLKWVVVSNMEELEAKKTQLEYLKELKSMNFEQDPTSFFIFCRIMVNTAIHRSMHQALRNNEPRPMDRLDFRYIDALVSLLDFMMKMFSLQKHEFITKILEYVAENLVEQHKTMKAGFNQRPFFRVIVNIVKLVASSDQFTAN